MIENPGLQDASLDDFKDQSSNLCTQELRNRNNTPKRTRWLRKNHSKRLEEDFHCVGWEYDSFDEVSAGDISLLSWLESRALEVTVGNSKWTVRPEWEKFLSVDIRSRCRALEDNQEWTNLCLDLKTRSMTDVGENILMREKSFHHSSHKDVHKSQQQPKIVASFLSQSFAEDQRQKSIRLAKTDHHSPLRRTVMDNVKQSDVDSNTFRRHSLKSYQSCSRIEPIFAKHEPSQIRYQELAWKQSARQKSLGIKDDCKSPGLSNNKSPLDHMQAYRKRKQEQNVLKIKEANFVTPGETTQCFANILEPKKSLTRSELDSVENKIYVQKYTDVSFLQKSSWNQGLDKNSLVTNLCQVHRTKKDTSSSPAEAQVGRPQVHGTASAPKVLSSSAVASDLISADIASEKAALDSLHLLQSLERKRRGRPIKTRLLGTDKISNPSSPDLVARPFGVDILKASHGKTLNGKEKLHPRPSISIIGSRNNPFHPTKLFTFAPSGQHWKT